MRRRQPRSTRTDTLFPYTTLFRSAFAKLMMVEAPGSAPGSATLMPDGVYRHSRLAPADDNIGPCEGTATVGGAISTRPPPSPYKTACQPRRRSEAHTSELQALMRISYAVFCLKKKQDTHKRI